MRIAPLLKYTTLFTWSWATFWLALWLSWQSLAQMNFLYPVWHDHFGIDEHIEHYAPQNRYRAGFIETSAEERILLFQGIVNAIQNHGDGLNTLQYTYQGKSIPLLHEAEIIHLEDVAKLISTLNQATLFIFILWLGLSGWMLFKGQKQLKNHQAWWFIGLGLLILGLILVAIGAEEVFYKLHVWIFPDNHQWFFYYQDSLMSTMMKAPDLFAYIAACLTTLALLYFSLILSLWRRLPIKQNK